MIRMITLVSWLWFSAGMVWAEMKDTVAQVSTINALLSGLYDGQVSLSRLRRYGDLGIGTFDALDGEMLMLDGRIYKIKGDGTVERPPLSEKTPFASVVAFNKEVEMRVSGSRNYRDLMSVMDTMAANPNLFYAVRIHGFFRRVTTRSVPEQQKPYRKLKEITASQQAFELADVEGTMVGFRCPDYVDGINVPGYHMHFINAQRSAGGHVLDFVADSVVVEIDPVHSFLMFLPETDDFARAHLAGDHSEELRAVEKQNE